MLFRLVFLGLTAMLISVGLPLQAQETDTEPSLPQFPSNCEPLPLVGGEGNEVTKEISPPSLSIPLPGPVNAGTRNNWHTDWFMPRNQAYRSYVVIFMPRNNREYDVSMYLKYPDDTNQRFYRQQRQRFNANEPITVEVAPERVDLAPYQVNTNIGGVQAVGARYTVAVAGCQ